jgi:hypothetical protein
MIKDTAGTHTYASSGVLTQFLTNVANDGLWVKWEHKTAKQWFAGIVATTKL